MIKRKTVLLNRVLGNGRYKILEFAGKGAFAEVYRGCQLNLNRDVAIKILNESTSSHDEVVKRFHHEAAAIARFDHPNIIKIFDHNEEDDIHYYVMNFLPRTLRTSLQPNRPLPDDLILQVAYQLSSALDYACRIVKNFVHRDIKPENIMLDQSHNVILSDFGLVRGDQLSLLTLGNQLIGTPIYMSPEQISSRKLDIRSDLYSLGVLLFECATGTTPFKGELLAVCHQHVNEPPPSPKTFNPNIPEGLDLLLLKLLSKKPEQRPQSAAELMQELEALPRKRQGHWEAIYHQPTISVEPETDSFSGKTSSIIPLSDYSLPYSEKKSWPVYTALLVSISVIALIFFSYFRPQSNSSEKDLNLSPEPIQPIKALELQYGSLEANSRPPGATIFINGIKQPVKTPIKIDSVKLGNYSVTLSLPGYQKWQGTVVINNLQASRITPELIKNPRPLPAVQKTLLTVISTPPSEIMVNGKSYGIPEDGELSLNISVGKYRIASNYQQYTPQIKNINLKTGIPQTVEFKWFGTISVIAFDENSLPVFGFVLLNDERTEHRADGQEWQIPVGQYEIAVQKFGYTMKNERQPIIVQGGERYVVTVPMETLR